jgi:predicted chitinase
VFYRTPFFLYDIYYKNSLMKKFIITEEDKKHIRKLYLLSEDESMSKLERAIDLFLPIEKEKEDDESTDSESSDTEDSEDEKKKISVSDVKGLNTNEQIVFEQLKEDGFTDEAAAGVMGVVGGESGFKTFKEASYKNTSNGRIRAIFPSKLGKMSDSQLNRIKKSDKLFFDAVYGGMYGNAPDEGYLYVGRGFNGITFKGNYKAAQDCTGISFVSNPELMEDPSNAAKALSCYFKKIKDISDFEKAFQEAFRQNAGPGHSWEYYANSTNPVAVTGIPLKREKAKQYYKKITGEIS